MLIQTQSKSRFGELDALKGIAIIAVVLYHFVGTVLPYGYLGVEIFFPISGYLLMKSLLKAMENGKLSFWSQVTNRTLKFFPSVLTVAILSVGVALFTMLPDDLENLAQSVIASSGFGNNILAAITTKDYWDAVNVFKPLMHTWYIGVFVQAYVVIIAAVALCNRFAKDKKRAVTITTIVITALSLVLFLLPQFAEGDKFYFLPFRLFEITAGSLVALFARGVTLTDRGRKTIAATKLVLAAVLVAFLVVNTAVIPAPIKLLSVVCLTTAYVVLTALCPQPLPAVARPLTFLGEYSFPIYITHQCVVAFFYYSFVDRLTVIHCIVFAAVVAVASWLLHLLVEKPVDKWMKAGKQKALWIGCITAAVAVCGVSGWIYLQAGVVRDIPELDITKANATRGMHAAYCDVPHSWNHDFTDSDKVKVLVIGDSYGRDWANILNESAYSEQMEISYIYNAASNCNDLILRRTADADIVFHAIFGKTDVPQFVLDNVPREKLYVIGHKTFGISNGFVYRQRYSDTYFECTQPADQEILAFNREMAEKYGDRFIDILSYAMVDDTHVRVFSDDHRYLSQDCRHLTRGGAQFFAKAIDLSFVVEAK